MLSDKQRAMIAVACTGKGLWYDKGAGVVELIQEVQPLMDHIEAQRGQDLRNKEGWRPLVAFDDTDVQRLMNEGVNIYQLPPEEFRKLCMRQIADKPKYKYEHSKKYV